MCSMCLSSPCRQGCPNASEPIPVHTCRKCGSGIYEGEKYFDALEGAVCEECLSDMAMEEILKMCGEELQTAEREG